MNLPTNLAEPSRLKRTWLDGCLVLLIFAAGFFSNFAVSGNSFLFVALMLVSCVVYFWRLRGAVELREMWFLAIVLRLIALTMSPGDDIYRYLWEGHIQWRGYNPYLLAPDALELSHLRTSYWPLINHPDWAAIYPPGAEIFFKFMARWGPSILALKLVFLLADLGVVYLLTKMTAQLRQVAWYAWNPLVVYSFAGAGHFDSIMLVMLVFAVYALGKVDDSWRWSVTACLALGAGISLKLVPLLVIPIFAIRLGRRFWLVSLSLLVPLGLALCYGFPRVDILDSFRRFSAVTRFNDMIWWISERFIWANTAQKNGVYTLILAAVVSVVSWLAWKDWRKALLWVLGASLIFSTVIHPWYITWILPFAAMRKSSGWFVLSGTVFLAFLWWESTPLWTAWQPSPLLSLSIYLPPLLFVFWKKAGTKLRSVASLTAS